MELSDEKLQQLPTIILQFQGHSDSNQELLIDPIASKYLSSYVDFDHPYDILFVISPSIYMEHNDDDGMYQSSIYFDEPGNNVLGANLMANHDIYFDIDSDRIGIAESACDYNQLVNEPLSAQTNSIENTNPSALDTSTASISQLHPTRFTLYDIGRPATFFIVLLAVIGLLLHFIFTGRKTTETTSTKTNYGTIRRGRRRRLLLPSQLNDDKPILHRTRTVARSISGDRSEFNSLRMSQLSGVLPSSKYHNPSPARQHHAITENAEPTKLSRSISVGDNTFALLSRADKENKATTPTTTTTREVRRGDNMLRSRSYHISFKATSA